MSYGLLDLEGIHFSVEVNGRNSPWLYESEFFDWHKNKLADESATSAQELFEKLEDQYDPSDVKILAATLLQSCFCASRFAKDFVTKSDPDTKARDQYRDAYNRSKEYASQLREIAKELQAPARGNTVTNALYLAEAIHNVKIRSASGSQRVDVLYGSVLTALAGAFEDHFFGHNAGTHESRFAFGCLTLSNPLNSRRSPTVETSLLFDLVFRLRTFSNKDWAPHNGGHLPDEAWQIEKGWRMPGYGKPNYPLATALVSLTFGCHTSANTATNTLKSFIEKNSPSIRPWPDSLIAKAPSLNSKLASNSSEIRKTAITLRKKSEEKNR